MTRGFLVSLAVFLPGMAGCWWVARRARLEAERTAREAERVKRERERLELELLKRTPTIGKPS